MIIDEKKQFLDLLEKATELALSTARQHVEIIENECKKVTEKFKCNPSDLIIEYHDKSVFVIKVMGSKFSIENTYTIWGENDNQ